MAKGAGVGGWGWWQKGRGLWVVAKGAGVVGGGERGGGCGLWQEF